MLTLIISWKIFSTVIRDTITSSLSKRMSQREGALRVANDERRVARLVVVGAILVIARRGGTARFELRVHY